MLPLDLTLNWYCGWWSFADIEKQSQGCELSGHKFQYTYIYISSFICVYILRHDHATAKTDGGCSRGSHHTASAGVSARLISIGGAIDWGHA